MLEAHSLVTQHVAEDNNNNGKHSLYDETIGLPFQDQLLDMVRQQQSLLAEYKERQEQQMFDIAEKLTEENC